MSKKNLRKNNKGKKPSISEESFSLFLSLLKDQWKNYLWFVIGRCCSASLYWMMILLGALALVFISGTTELGQLSISLVVVIYGIVLIASFGLDAFFSFCLYRSLDRSEKNRSMGAFLKRGAENFWTTFIWFTLGGFLALAVGFAFSIPSYFLVSMGGILHVLMMVLSFAALVYCIPVLFMVFFEIILHKKRPLASVIEQTQKLGLTLWFKLFGALFFWVLVATAFIMFVGGVFVVLFYLIDVSLHSEVILMVAGFPLVIAFLLFAFFIFIVPVYGSYAIYAVTRNRIKN